MRFIDLRYKRKLFDLPSPIKITNQEIFQKEVILLKAIDDKGGIHFGEIGPLAGFSNESIIEVEEILDGLVSKWEENDINEISEWIKTLSEFPSLKFGLEQLLFSSKFCYSEQIKGRKEINLNALVGLEAKDKVIKRIEELVQFGFKTIKLKIGRINFDDDLIILNELKKKFGYDINLRLDNNASWKQKEAVKNIQLLSKFNIEYLEQPVENIKELLISRKSGDTNIAPDESITSYEDGINFIESEKVKFIVLKPSIRIGLFDTLKLIEYANLKGTVVVITSAFETAITRNTLLYLASQANHRFAHGLNLPLLGEDIIKSDINDNLPKIFFNTQQILKSISVDFND